MSGLYWLVVPSVLAEIAASSLSQWEMKSFGRETVVESKVTVGKKIPTKSGMTREQDAA